MKPAGSKEPLVYILGEAPGREDDDRNKHFAGDSGRVLRARIPEGMEPFVRWNNVVRTHTPKSRKPEPIEVEACRPSVERDIAATKPKAIFGFGTVPLHWVIGQGSIGKWRGRRIPVEIGGHQCWFYSFEDPEILLRQRKRNGDISENERTFRFDLKRAFDEVEELPPPVILSRADAEAGVEIIPCTNEGLARIEQFLTWAAMQPVVGVDYETNTLRPYGKPIMDRSGKKVARWEEALILSAAVGTPKTTISFAFDHPQAKWSKGQRARLEELWNDFLRAPQVRKAVHNLAFEMEWSAVFYGADVLRESLWDCTYTQAALLDERAMADSEDRRMGGASLDDLVLNHFGLHLKNLSPLDRKDLSNEPLDQVLRYNGMDAKFHVMLYLVQRGQLEAQGFQRVYIEDDLERVATMVLTQMKGVPRAPKVTAALQTKYADRIERLEKEIAALPEVKQYEKIKRRPYNPMSNADCITMFRDIQERKEGFTKDQTRESGFVSTHPSQANYAVDKSVLEKIGTKLAELTIELRESNKRKSTYIDPYADGSEFVWPDGLLHPIINPQGTKSGRSSAKDPNVQNIPKRDEEAKEVRRQIRPSNDNEVVFAVDYGQIQARGIGVASRDKVFCKALWEKYDVHTEWAERIARAYPSRVGGKQNFTDKKIMKAFRGDVKNQWTFPLFFGAKLYGISQFLHIPEEVLQPLMDEFWNTFSGVADWHQEMLKQYHTHGCVKHLNGRINRAPLSFNQMINYPIQGFEADIVLSAYTKLSKRATDTGDINWQPNLETHDDLTFILPADKVGEYAQTIVTDMLSIHRPYINVPLTVEVSVGEDLLALEEVLVASSDNWPGVDTWKNRRAA